MYSPSTWHWRHPLNHPGLDKPTSACAFSSRPSGLEVIIIIRTMNNMVTLCMASESVGFIGRLEGKSKINFLMPKYNVHVQTLIANSDLSILQRSILWVCSVAFISGRPYNASSSKHSSFREEYQAVKRNNPNIKMAARKLLEYGESREGYWTSDKLTRQMAYAVKVAEAKYPKDQRYRLLWVFDQSSCKWKAQQRAD